MDIMDFIRGIATVVAVASFLGTFFGVILFWFKIQNDVGKTSSKFDKELAFWLRVIFVRWIVILIVGPLYMPLFLLQNRSTLYASKKPALIKAVSVFLIISNIITICLSTVIAISSTK